MASVTVLTVLLFLLIATAGGEKKKSSDKIIIHVPYKILKHHHTHTKYKVITIPAPKKEQTVIYLKEQIQPVIKEVPEMHTQVEITESQPKTPYEASEVIIPPHQQSAQAYLTDIADHKGESETLMDQQHEYSTITAEHKPLETYTSQHSQSLIPSFSHKPVILSSQDNLIHDFSFKSMPLSHYSFPSKFFHSQPIHQSHASFNPKFIYQPMILPQKYFPSQYLTKMQFQHAKPLQDSVAHTTSQVYKTILPKPGGISYKVKEEDQEDALHLGKHQHTSNAIPVPLPKSKRKGKNYIYSGPNQIKNLKRLPYNNDYEYEHVGYLIIDGNSKKMVGKNLKDELHLYR